jgi:hypothetical protein
MAITGLELKMKLGTLTFFKFLRKDLTHNGFKYKIGENFEIFIRAFNSYFENEFLNLSF